VEGGAAVPAACVLGQVGGETERGPVGPGQGRHGSSAANIARAKTGGTVGGIPTVSSSAAMHFLRGKAVKRQQGILIDLELFHVISNWPWGSTTIGLPGHSLHA